MEAFFNTLENLPRLSQALEGHITGLKGEIRNLWALRRNLKKGIRQNFETEVLKLIEIRARQHKEVDRFIDSQVTALNKSIDQLKIAQTEATEMSKAGDVNALRRVAAAIQSGVHEQKHVISYYAGQTEPNSLLNPDLDLVNFRVYKNSTNVDVSFQNGAVVATPGDIDQEIQGLSSESQAEEEEHKGQGQELQQKLLVSSGDENSLHVFNVSSGEYIRIYPDYELPVHEACESENECIYVLGGKREEKAISEVKAVDMTGKSKDLPNMNVARAGTGSIIVGNYLYVVGGCDENQQDLVSCERLDIENPAQWQQISPLETAACYGRCISSNDRILLLGGQNDEDGFLDLVQEYSVPNDRWSSLETRLPQKCSLLAAAIGNTGILMWGGSMESGYSDAIYLQSDRIASLPKEGEFEYNQIIRTGYCYSWMNYEDSESGEQRLMVLKLSLSDGSYQQLEDVDL